MITTRPPASEIVARGTKIYEAGIKAKFEADNIGRFIAIDTESGDYEIGDDHYETVDILKARRPDALVCTLKIGYPAVAAIGGGLRPNSELSQS